MKVDMHIHTRCSDGGREVSEIIELAKENKCEVISITDHCNISAYDKLKNINIGNLRIINGIEIDVFDNDTNYHFTLYNFKLEDKEILKYIDEVKEYEKNIFYEEIKKIENEYNISLDENITKKFLKDNYYLDKTRLNELLVLNHLASDGRDAYYKYTNIIDDHKRYRISFERVMDIASKSNALLVLAHPCKYKETTEERLEIIEGFRKRGLKAVEVFCTKSNDNEEKIIEDYCIKNNMMISGGSDYHAKFGHDEKRHIGEIRDKILDSSKLTINIL